MSKQPMGPGAAIGLGAIGCLGLVILLGVCVAATGGTAYFDAGGILLVLIIGALLGFGAWLFYSKGRSDALGPASTTYPPGRRSVDDLVAEVERDYREGKIDEREYERRLKYAWRGQMW